MAPTSLGEHKRDARRSRAGARANIAAPTAVFIALLETIGGALLILGFATRPIALLLAGDMLVALLLVEGPSGTLLQVGHYQLTLLLSPACFLLFAFGPGPCSCDRLLGWSRR